MLPGTEENARRDALREGVRLAASPGAVRLVAAPDATQAAPDAARTTSEAPAAPAAPAPEGTTAPIAARPATDGSGAPAAAPVVLHESTWLLETPWFYNTRTGAAGTDINAVIDYANLEIDREGLAYFIAMGYSAFGRTPVRDVRMLEPYSRLLRHADGRLEVQQLPDRMAEAIRGPATRPEDAIEAIREQVALIERKASGALIVPASGGLDSTMAAAMIGDRSRARLFTFGTSPDPDQAQEVQRARELARLLGARWERVDIGGFHRYLPDWYRLYGPSMHAHGMYQIDFYRRVAPRVGPDPMVVSGAFGDWPAGIRIDKRLLHAPWRGPQDVLPMFVWDPEHGDVADLAVLPRLELVEEYYERHRELRHDIALRGLETLRMRGVWVSYLLRVPRSVGLAAETPYIDERTVMLMFGIPLELRVGRVWEHRFLDGLGLNLDHVSGDTTNVLNLEGLLREPLPPLDVDLLAEVVKRDRVRWVNRHTSPASVRFERAWRNGQRRGLRRAREAFERAGVRPYTARAYHWYILLWPLQEMLRRRDAAQRGEGQQGEAKRGAGQTRRGGAGEART